MFISMANPYVSPNAQREHICIFTEVPQVPRSADPQFRNTRWSLLLSNEAEVEEKKMECVIKTVSSSFQVCSREFPVETSCK